MADAIEDPDKRSRWLAGTAIAMLLSTLVGFLFFLSWSFDHKDGLTWARTASALKSVTMIIFGSFWVLFPMLYFGYIRNSTATLEYHREVRKGEMEWTRRDAGSGSNARDQGQV